MAGGGDGKGDSGKMSDRIGVGVIGVGRMGAFHAEVLARLPEARLVGVADVNPDAARRMGEELEIFWTGDPEALLARRDLEAVVVAVPSRRHVETVGLALRAGRHVLCEKPLALTLEETETVAVAARRAGVILQVGFMRRFDPGYRRARERIAAGAVGRPTLFKSLQFDAGPPPPSIKDPAQSGGILVDMGIHEFDLGRWMLGDEIVAVQAQGAALLDAETRRLGDADTVVVNLVFASGALGSVELSRNAAYGDDVRTEILGDRGSLFVGALPVGLGAMATASGLTVDPLPVEAPRFQLAFEEQARAFLRAVHLHRPAPVGGRDSWAALAVALAAREAMATGGLVRPPQPPASLTG
jgi:predicted dehydrogenase